MKENEEFRLIVIRDTIEPSTVEVLFNLERIDAAIDVAKGIVEHLTRNAIREYRALLFIWMPFDGWMGVKGSVNQCW